MTAPILYDYRYLSDYTSPIYNLESKSNTRSTYGG